MIGALKVMSSFPKRLKKSLKKHLHEPEEIFIQNGDSVESKQAKRVPQRNWQIVSTVAQISRFI